MKLGTLRNGSRDGELAVVSRDNTRFARAGQIAPTMQSALDNWEECAPRLQELFESLCAGETAGEAVEIERFHAPLPRAYEWVDGSAYINHIVLVRKARNAAPPETLLTDPLVYQGGSGVLMGPTDDIVLHEEGWGLDFESEVCVVLGDTPMGTAGEEVDKHIRLFMLCNDVTLRNLIPGELKKGFGFFCSKPASAFSPFAVTADELGDAWKDGRVDLDMETRYNGSLFGDVAAGPEMHFSFRDIVGHITRTRSFTAGTIVGSGTVSNEDVRRGSSCLSEKRMLEKIGSGTFTTPFMKVGDRVQINMLGRGGGNVFGTIDQRVVAP
jgi:fumarylacetoacetate (FAA) hydrolase